MVRRPVRRVPLLLLALLVVLVPAALVIGSRTNWAHQRLHEVITRELAQFFQREVAVGPISGDIVFGLTIDGLAIAEGQYLRDGAVITARRVVIDYDLWSVLRGRLAPLASIARLDLWGMNLRVVRDRQGALNLTRLIPPPRAIPPAKRFRGQIVVHDSAVVYLDYGPGIRLAPLTVRAADLQGKADLRKVVRIKADASARVLDGRADRISAHVMADIVGPYSSVDLSVDNLDAGWLMGSLSGFPDYTITGGRASGTASFYQVQYLGKTRNDYSTTLQMNGVTLGGRKLTMGPVRLDGTAWLGDGGARAQSLRASVGGTAFEVSGWAYLQGPTLDLALSAPAVRLQPFVQALPPDARRRLSIPEAGVGSVVAQVIGPASDPDVRLRVNMQDRLTVRLADVGVVKADGLSVTADVVSSTANPSVRTTLSAQRVEVPSLKVSATAGQFPRSVTVGPMQGFHATAQLCGNRPVVQAVVRTPFLRADQLRAANVSTNVVLVDDVLRLQGLRAQALGGTVAAEAVLRLTRPQLGARVRGHAEGIDLSRLRELPVDLPQHLAGAANATFQAHVTRQRFAGNVTFSAAAVAVDDARIGAASGTMGIEGDGHLSGVGRVTASGITSGDFALDRSEALVRFQDRSVEILSGYGRGPDGLFWAQGNVGLEDKHLDLQVQTAELDVGSLAERAKLGDLGGAAYLSGHVTGTFDKPHFEGRATVFNPRLEKTRLSGLTGHVTWEDDHVLLEDLLANRGTSLVTGRLALSNLGQGRDQIALSGRLEGENVRLEELADLTDQELPISGRAEFEADVGGTLGNPSASGTIRLANASYKDFVVGRAEMPFQLADRRLTIPRTELTVLESPLQAEGTITLGDHPQISARVSGAQMRLEGLAPLLDSKLPIGGTATIEELHVSGPTDELQGEARIAAQEVMIGDERLGDLTARLSIAGGRLQLEQTSFQLGNGRVTISGAVDTSARPRTVDAQVQLLQTDVSDLLFLAVPIAGALDDRSKQEREDLQLALRSYGLRLTGPLDGTFNVSGPVDAPTVVVEATHPLTAPQLVFDGRPLPEIAVSGRATKDDIRDLALTAHEDDALITATGNLAFDGDIDLTVEGSGITMAKLEPWIQFRVPVAGRLGFTVQATGMTRRPDLIATVGIQQPSIGGVEFAALNLPPTTVSDRGINIDTLELTLVDQGVEKKIAVNGFLPFSWSVPGSGGGRGHPGLLPDGRIAMQTQVQNTPLSFFLPLLADYLKARHDALAALRSEDAARAARTYQTLLSTLERTTSDGQVNSSLTVEGTVDDPIVRGHFGLAQGTVLPKGWKTALTDVNADIDFAGLGQENLVAVKSVKAAYDHTHADLTGRFWLQDLKPEEFWSNAFDLRLTVGADAQALPGGTQISDLKGAITLKTENQAQVIRPEGLTMKIGEGHAELTGSASLTQLRLADLANNDYDLHLAVTNGRLIYRPYLDAIANGSFDVQRPSGAAAATVHGKWLLSDGRFGLIAPPTGETGLSAASSRFPRPNLDIVAGIGRNLQIRGAGVRAPLQEDSRAAVLTGTPQAPKLIGTIIAGRGTTTLPTATLRLRGLSIQYVVEPVPGSLADPMPLRLRGTVEGTAETTVMRPGSRPIYVLVRIAGSLPDKVTIATSSNPPLTETQIYALLGGVPFAYLPGVGGAEGSLGQVVSEQFLATLAAAFRMSIFEPIQEELERVLGLELGVTFAFNQPVTIQIGKYVLRNLLITYERPLTEGGGRFDVRVSYELPAGLRITYHNDERNISQFEIGYSFTF